MGIAGLILFAIGIASIMFGTWGSRVLAMMGLASAIIGLVIMAIVR